MNLQLFAKLEAGSIALTHFQWDAGPLVDITGAGTAYAEPLLTLFASYISHCTAKLPRADFKLVNSTVADKFKILLANVRRQSTHRCRPLLLEYPDAQEGKALFVVRKSTVTFTQDVLDDVTILVDDEKLPVNHSVHHRDNLDAFLEWMKLSGQANGWNQTNGGMPSIREGLEYEVYFEDKYDELAKHYHDGETKPSIAPNPQFMHKDYRYFTAWLKFRRLSVKGSRSFRVKLLLTDRAASGSFDDDVVYREVFSVFKQDRPILENICRTAREQPGKRESLLSQALHLVASVNKEQVDLSDISLIPGDKGIDIRYDLPEHLFDKLRLDWVIRLTACRERTVLSFPIVTSQVTFAARHTFDATGADIGAINCFPRETANSSVVEEEGNRVVFESKKGRFQVPGEGQVLYWAPVERVDHVELVSLKVSLKEFEGRGLILEPVRGLHPFDELFLVRESANKLRRALEALNGNGLGLKVLDAYRKCTRNDSGHQRGCSVHVVPISMDKLRDLALPSAYFHDHPEPPQDARRSDLSGVSNGDDAAASHYRQLRNAMLDAGFEDTAQECWWHFRDREWRRFPTIGDLPATYKSAATPGANGS